MTTELKKKFGTYIDLENTEQTFNDISILQAFFDKNAGTN
jgi:hypothetical protein